MLSENSMNTKTQLTNMYTKLQNDKNVSYDALDAELKTAAGLMSRVAHECTFEEFEAFVKNGDVPPVSLTNEEMELLEAGGPYGKLFRLLAIICDIFGW